MSIEQIVSSNLEQTRQVFLTGLPKKIARLEDCWNHLRHVQWDAQTLTVAYQLSHSLVGSAATLSLNKIGDELKIIYDIVSQLSEHSSLPNQQQSDAVLRSLSQLKALSQPSQTKLEVGLENQVSSPTTLSPQKLIYLVDDEQVIRDVLGDQLQAAGLKVKTFEKIQQLYSQLKTENPSLVILDIAFPTEGALAGIDALQNLRVKTGFQVPVIFISARSDLVARLRCLRAGGNGFFPKPVEVDDLLQKINELTASEQEKYRALLIDDDEMSLELQADVLQKANFLVSKVVEPLKALKEINAFKPDVLLLDLMMPKCNGLELAKLLRQDAHFANLPIIFLTGVDTDKAKQLTQAIEHSSFLTKPATAVTLTDVCLKNARQYRFYISNQIALHNPSNQPQVLPRHQLIEVLESLLDSGSDNLGQIHLLYISLDQLENIRQHFGLRRLDEINQAVFNQLMPLLQSKESIAALSDGIFMLLLQRNFKHSLTSANQIEQQLRQLQFSKEDASLTGASSIGLLSLDTCIANSTDTITYAEAAATQANTLGGQRVVCVLNKASDELPTENQLVLDGKLEAAVKSKNYLLNYQSIIDLSDPSFDAYEVLVRLQDDIGRELPPIQFLDTVHELEAAVEMDRWIYTSTLNAISKNQRNLMEANIFFKVCEETLNFNLLPSFISGLIDETRIRGKDRLIFMLNYQHIINNIPHALKFAKNLRNIHCNIGVENFNLNDPIDFIHDLKPLFIKPSPESLRQALDSSETHQQLEKLIIQCQQLKVGIIGSTVEDNRTLQHCLKMGIKYIQGFLIQRPSQIMQHKLNYNSINQK